MASQVDPNEGVIEKGETVANRGGHGGLRVYWMAIGNLALLTAAGLISKQPVWTVTLLDGVYLLIVASLFLARYVDIKRFGGETANGEPASQQHLVRYGAGLAAASAGLWGLVQAVNV